MKQEGAILGTRPRQKGETKQEVEESSSNLAGIVADSNWKGSIRKKER